MSDEKKRLFFGMEVKAPWPEKLPQGRLLDKEHRHMTLAFLGQADFLKIKEAFPSFPQPSFKLGLAATFDQCLFFPTKRPHVAAWHLRLCEKEGEQIEKFYRELVQWLREQGFSPDLRHAFNPHVTLARTPFQKNAWLNIFQPLPAIIQDIHLYESSGNSKYTPLWTYTLLSPFEELEHTADIAYLVRGYNYDQLYQHACLALCFSFPVFLPYFQPNGGFADLQDVIIALNQTVTQADQEIGCPFKAVSFHSKLETNEDILNWEMIVDV